MDIGDRQGFLDEVVRWETRWNMVDGQKPQTLLETLNVTNTIFQRVSHLTTSSRNPCLSPISVRKESKIELVV
jgi:hypothetical protein